jgi:anti-anti-sigma factor
MSTRRDPPQGERMTIDRQRGARERTPLSWPRQPTARPRVRVPGTLGVTVAASAEGEASAALAGELDVAHAPRVERMLRTLVERGCNASIDASAVSFIDATGVAALIRARDSAAGLGRALVIVSASLLSLFGRDQPLATLLPRGGEQLAHALQLLAMLGQELWGGEEVVAGQAGRWGAGSTAAVEGRSSRWAASAWRARGSPWPTPHRSSTRPGSSWMTCRGC